MNLSCELCFHRCTLAEGQTGLCRARGNRNGQIVPLNYGKLTALALDPIEKKPLRRFYPGSFVLSVGSFGCNLRCPFCQNARIAASGGDLPTRYYSPEELVAQAVQLRPQGNIGLAYTYNEPLVGYEYVRDCARLAHAAGLVNVLVTNGTIAPAPWQDLLPLLDGINIDLKGFMDSWYRTLGGDLETVKAAITLAAPVCHVEVTTLIVPGANDSPEEMTALASWLASVDPEIPLHISRFFPCHRMTDRAPTPTATIYHLAETAKRFLSYVYTGNC